MKTIVIYDSIYGNTEKVAKEIGKKIKGSKVSRITEIKKINDYELVIVGSPTHAGRPTPEMKKFLDSIPKDGLKGIKVAAFDTRADLKKASFFLKIFAKILGYASPRIMKIMVQKGGIEFCKPEGFFVEDKTGPLSVGEIERSSRWVNES